MTARKVNLETVDATERPARTGVCSNPLRVLHLNAGNLYGGVETILTTLASRKHLCPRMEPHFAVCYEARSSRELAAAGVAVHLLGPARISRPWTVWRARRLLRQLLRSEHYDLIVCHMAWSLVVFGGAAREEGRKVALWAHGPQNKKTWLDRMAVRITPDIVIANSCFTAVTVRQHFPRTPVQVLYYPVALGDTAEAGRWRTAMRRECAVDDDTTVILQVGRLESWKGYATHLRALAQLKATEKWVCWIAGGPQTPDQEEYFRRLQETAIRLGLAARVRFLGQRTDVPKLLAAADIFCQPNEGPEPFGIVFVEALWAGLPVISSALGGAVEIVDESCGLLVKPGDADSVAQALRCLIESPELRQRLGRSGPSRAQQLCDAASQMSKLRELLQAEVSRGGNS
jgi:glycosyltransferase involved in cell wall biosynthesis